MNEAAFAAELAALPERMTAVELEEVRAGCEPRHDDPVVIYARPYFQVGPVRVAFHREYEVAVRVPGCVEAVRGWAAAMRADALPEQLIAGCALRVELLAADENDRCRKLDSARAHAAGLPDSAKAGLRSSVNATARGADTTHAHQAVVADAALLARNPGRASTSHNFDAAPLAAGPKDAMG